MKPGTREWQVDRAAGRVKSALQAADVGGYGHTGAAWASYIARDDVQVVLEDWELLVAKVVRIQAELAHWRTVAEDRKVAA